MPRIAARDRAAFVETRQSEIVEAALGLWAKRGYDATPMDAIAREAGMSKGNLYLYFPSKLALLEEVIRRNSLLPNIEQAVKTIQEASLEETVRLLVEGIWDHLRERRELVMITLRELPTHIELAEHFVERLLVPTNKLFAAYLSEKLGPERSQQINTLVAGRSLIGMVLIFFITQEILGGSRVLPIPERDIVATISELFLNGVVGRGKPEC